MEEESDENFGTIKKQLFLEDESSDTQNVDTPVPVPHSHGLVPLLNQKQPVLIYLRIRPKRQAEVLNQDPDCLHQTSEHELVAVPPKTSKTYKNNTRSYSESTFSFSRIFSPATTQKELFDETLKPLLKDFFDGQNCLVFTYGITNSGKAGLDM